MSWPLGRPTQKKMKSMFVNFSGTASRGTTTAAGAGSAAATAGTISPQSSRAGRWPRPGADIRTSSPRLEVRVGPCGHIALQVLRRSHAGAEAVSAVPGAKYVAHSERRLCAEAYLPPGLCRTHCRLTTADDKFVSTRMWSPDHSRQRHCSN